MYVLIFKKPIYNLEKYVHMIEEYGIEYICT